MEHLFQPSRYPKITFRTGGRQIRLLAKTDAPPQYDGFGTVTLAEVHGSGRLVLIHEDHLEWQIRRYMSGMWSTGPVEYPPMPDDDNPALTAALSGM